ncbi:hypothetical protein MATL_G00167900 [Megalops atlanticus]|uniref:Uncharacterized protein n=1 Tax=Megalops atlanticus TaxID=7932 RepID=A0A9D3T6W7_MEGAT|nr:hypothetical protein MATL_G00167900 [Megalops atlanticus]
MQQEVSRGTGSSQSRNGPRFCFPSPLPARRFTSALAPRARESRVSLVGGAGGGGEPASVGFGGQIDTALWVRLSVRELGAGEEGQGEGIARGSPVTLGQSVVQDLFVERRRVRQRKARRETEGAATGSLIRSRVSANSG